MPSARIIFPPNSRAGDSETQGGRAKAQDPAAAVAMASKFGLGLTCRQQRGLLGEVVAAEVGAWRRSTDRGIGRHRRLH